MSEILHANGAVRKGVAKKEKVFLAGAGVASTFKICARIILLLFFQSKVDTSRNYVHVGLK